MRIAIRKALRRIRRERVPGITVMILLTTPQGSAFLGDLLLDRFHWLSVIMEAPINET
jgi:hypothetical protein